MNQALDFPLPPVTGAYGAEPAAARPAAAVPEVDELTALRAKVAELEHVVSLAKTRVETLGAEKREALERAQRLQAQLDAAARTVDETTVGDLLNRVAALEAIVSPSRAA